MLTDPISDYLNRIRNALLAEHEEVEIPNSRLKREMTRILNEERARSAPATPEAGSADGAAEEESEGSPGAGD